MGIKYYYNSYYSAIIMRHSDGQCYWLSDRARKWVRATAYEPKDPCEGKMFDSPQEVIEYFIEKYPDLGIHV